MKQLSSTPLLIFFLLGLSTLGITQTVFFEQNFNNGFPTGWSRNPDGEGTFWQLRGSGDAPFGQFWNGRSRINSESDGGAMVFDADGYQSNPETLIPFPHRGALISPFIDVTGRGRIGLRFYQYYHNFESVTSIGVSIDDGQSWQDVSINQNIGTGAETANGNIVLVELTDLVRDASRIQVRFLFEGSNFFWIIDDIQLLELPPTFGQTFPSFLGDSLDTWEIPYLVDEIGGAYPPNELAIEWAPDARESFKDSLRNTLQVITYDTCTCSNLELFHFADTFELSLDENLLVNGDFEDGATGFRSELNNNCGNCAVASYCVGTQMIDICPINTTWINNNFFAFNNPGSNQFLIVDGSITAGTDIWCQDVTLEANETYLFAFRGRNLVAGSDNPQLQLLANGIPVNTANVVNMDAAGNWDLYFVQWTTGVSVPATLTLCLEQINGGLIGNDYGIDDLILVKDGRIILNIEEKKATADQQTEGVQEVDYNYFNGDFIDIKNTPDFYGSTFPDLPQVEDEPNEKEVVVAILDTGIDYNYTANIPGIGNLSIAPYLKRSSQACYSNDVLGWNFIDAKDLLRQNKPFDDHSHGTHVAGIMIQNWQALPDTCCALKILPVKTHNARGLGKLFDASCGIYYATEEKVNFINASWGFSAVQSNTGGILYNAIQYAKDEAGILLVTSAGNEGVSLNDHPDYPSNYLLPNILSVAALDSLEQIWNSSNFEMTTVDYAAKGVGIFSAVPPGSINNDYSKVWSGKSGTSMAAPVVTGAAAKLSCLTYEDPLLDVYGKLDILSENRTDLMSFFIDGRTLDMHDLIGKIVDCELLIDANEDLSIVADLSIFPNPVKDVLTISVKNSSVNFEQFFIWDALGKVVMQQAIPVHGDQWQQEVNVSHLSKGVYYITLVTAQGVLTKSVIKG
ncbi:MAG: S8/S53 family peptidase [Saprospiraceae bacterium]